MKQTYKDECIFSVYKTKPSFMREDEPRKRVSTVIKKEDSIGSFEDIEDFELPQRTTKERTSGPSGGNASGGNEDSFEVVNYDDLNNMKPQEGKSK